MRVIRFDHDPEAFARRVTPFLMTREAENCFFLGHIGSPDLKPDVIKIAIEDDRDEIVGVALKWPKRHLVMTDAPAKAVDLLVDHLIAGGARVEGIQSHTDVVRRFVDRYCAQTHAAASKGVAMALHVLSRVEPVADVAGSLRQCGPADIDLLAKWIKAFCNDCGLPPTKDGEHARAMQRIERGESHFWEVDGRPVSTASLNGPTQNGIRISVVYTPPEQRGCGYASACVAALSQRMLDSGKRFCFLYTDLANPTSNKIYRAIGYEPVCDNLQIMFDGSQGMH